MTKKKNVVLLSKKLHWLYLPETQTAGSEYRLLASGCIEILLLGTTTMR